MVKLHVSNFNIDRFKLNSICCNNYNDIQPSVVVNHRYADLSPRCGECPSSEAPCAAAQWLLVCASGVLLLRMLSEEPLSLSRVCSASVPTVQASQLRDLSMWGSSSCSVHGRSLLLARRGRS